jgi:uncharacterized protein (TIGR03086 family)
MDLLDLYDRSSAWAAEKVAGAKGNLDSPTGCEDWTARDLVNHLLDTANFFAGSAKGEKVDPPSPNPPNILDGNDPVSAFEESRRAVLEAYRDPKALEENAVTLGIAFSDSLIHGWDLAKGTGQGKKMPDDLAEAAYQMLNGRLTDENRKGAFEPPVEVPDDASAQEKLLAYVGRDPR